MSSCKDCKAFFYMEYSLLQHRLQKHEIIVVQKNGHDFDFKGDILASYSMNFEAFECEKCHEKYTHKYKYLQHLETETWKEQVLKRMRERYSRHPL